MDPIELDDIQRLLIQGYPNRRTAYYALLRVKDPAPARRWLAGLIDEVGTAAKESRAEDTERDKERNRLHERRLSIAFTWAGLEALGFSQKDPESGGFVGEFREGMVTSHRSLSLGDENDSSPREWYWGGGDPDQKGRGGPVHILLLVYSASKESLEAQWTEIENGLDGVALWPGSSSEFRNPTFGYLADDAKEHFGFRDGISQPYIAGSDTHVRPSGRYAAGATVAPGEFILGYRNEMGKLPASPRVPKAIDPSEILPVHPEDPSQSRDFGRNGTYLVLRQLEQHVDRFEDFLKSQAHEVEEQKRIAAKIVGRWQSGAPLVNAPEGDDPLLSTDNDFGFQAEDRYGLRCPVGSHIRRANPRDAFADPSMNISPEEAQGLVNRHRLIRRGRLYGKRGKDAEGKRGLLFMCLNANLQRQFEFVQQHWINGPKFGGLDNEVDPLIGAQPPEGGLMTVQERPLSRCVVGIPNFVTVRGGAYFFLPGLKALKFLAGLQ
jgi:Dyp-type peroxidase family